MTIPMLDLRREYRSLKEEIDGAVFGVLERGYYVLGEEVARFEEEFASYIGVRHAVGVGSGMAALHLALRALGIGPGDEVITVANTAAATAMAIAATGAAPVFCEISETSYNMDPDRLSEGITDRTRALLPVHLFGQPAPMEPILALAREKGLHVVEDACQAHGSRYRGVKTGALGDLGCFSFYPSKNLGGYGDGGMVTTDDPELADRVRMLRNYGQKGRYEHRLLGHNSRLDEIQAAILRVKLRHLDAWNERRRRGASLYVESLQEFPLVLPTEAEGAHHIYHLFVIRVPDRDGLRDFLRERGVITNIHYPLPLYRQKAFAYLRRDRGSLPVTERCTAEILSLPLFPWIEDGEIEAVSAHIGAWFERRGN
jgi:dTDP-4-amino-4,6-dideoxygalactose transaminase